jgi:hypothetical protein
MNSVRQEQQPAVGNKNQWLDLPPKNIWARRQESRRWTEPVVRELVRGEITTRNKGKAKWKTYRGGKKAHSVNSAAWPNPEWEKKTASAATEIKAKKWCSAVNEPGKPDRLELLHDKDANNKAVKKSKNRSARLLAGTNADRQAGSRVGKIGSENQVHRRELSTSDKEKFWFGTRAKPETN